VRAVQPAGLREQHGKRVDLRAARAAGAPRAQVQPSARDPRDHAVAQLGEDVAVAEEAGDADEHRVERGLQAARVGVDERAGLVRALDVQHAQARGEATRHRLLAVVAHVEPGLGQHPADERVLFPRQRARRARTRLRRHGPRAGRRQVQRAAWPALLVGEDDVAVVGVGGRWREQRT
jgi:hypothetical protein